MLEGTNDGDVCASVGSTGACATSIGFATQSANLTMSTEGGSGVVEAGVGSSEDVAIHDAKDIGSATQSVHTLELEEEDDSQDASEEARVIASIVERVAACDFPLTYPAEKTSLTTANAEEVLTWMQKHDHVAITSYIEEQWRLYRTSATRDPKKPEKVFYAEWIRDFCYLIASRIPPGQVGRSKG